MGNYWRGVSRQEMLQTELELIIDAGSIPREAVQVTDVSLDEDGMTDIYESQNFIHEVRVAGVSDDLPTLVMIHGYMAGGAYFYKMLSHLRSSFNIVLIDTLGQGCSGRPTLAPGVF